jgi:hypothetical protein
MSGAGLPALCASGGLTENKGSYVLLDCWDGHRGMKARLLARWRVGGFAVAALVGTGLLGRVARSEPATSWLTGSALRSRLDEAVDIYWSDTPLRHAVETLSRSYRVAVLIDRRVDPGQRLNLKLSATPLRGALERITEGRGLGVSWLGPVAYLGPSRAASRIRTLAELRRGEIRGLPASVGRRFLLPKPIRWDDFATPRDLLARLGAESGIEVFGLDQVPHDLWAGADLPPISLVDRLTLIAGQFDLTFQVAADGGSIALIPVPDDVAIERSYPGGRQARQLAAKWAALLPDSEVNVVGSQVLVRGLLEDHERLKRSPRTGRPPTPKRVRKGRGEETFTGKIAGQLGELLEQLAGQFELELRVDQRALEESGISLQRRVSVNVEDATIEELFEALAAEAGCTARRRGIAIEIRPAE